MFVLVQSLTHSQLRKQFITELFHLWFPLTDICSARLYGSYWDIPGGDIKLPWGYKKVFEDDYNLMKRISGIHFEAEVTEIDWKQEESQDKIVVKVCLNSCKNVFRRN